MRPVTVFMAMLAGLAALGAGGEAAARTHHHRVVHHSSRGSGGEDYYTAVSGDRVHRPMQADRKPAGATARCRDRTWSFSEHHRGTCSHHGGVASWL